eukprot:GFUD01014836.1.p1 GENE.GFUD01014836.1~~GFUD01014836.1.p1  ORF type:complete len:356 (-),score=124.55 GFUD01014836.1:51-1061(-)
MESEITKVNETVEKEKKDILTNIETFCSALEGNVQSHLQENNNELEMLTLKLSNERKELEIEIREDKTDNVSSNHENSFINMFKHLRKEIDTLQEKTDHGFEKTEESQNRFKETLNEKQKELETSLEKSRLQGKDELYEDKERMLESMKQSESALISKLSAMELDLYGKQEEGALKVEDMKTRLENQLDKFLETVRMPLSISFSAYRDVDYGGRGEEYLTFSGCSVNTASAMDPKSGTFSVPISGLYILSLSVCSQDRKKVLLSIRQNEKELASMYDQNHVDNHKNSMSSQMLVAELEQGDKIQVYMYTASAISDKKSNHFTQFSGILLRPANYLD